MKHLDDIRTLVDVLLASKSFHALTVESPPGWGKSSSVDKILREKGIEYERIATYTTAFHLFNALKSHPSKLFVIDDCVGILSDPNALAVLKAATWPVSGVDEKRILMWGSGNKEGGSQQVEFAGKIILLVNSMGYGIELKGLLSRVLYLQIITSDEEKSSLLREAATSVEMYPNSERAVQVAEFLTSRVEALDPGKLNFRSLRLGYELAENFPDKWEVLLEKLLTGERTPSSIVQTLTRSGIPVEEQVRRFRSETGLSRRTFFNYKKMAGN